MAHAATATPQQFDESDPHGGTPHTHVIVPPITLKLVLGVLLAFTALTVGIAQLEVWIMGYFDITLPLWVNVVGAMLIATVKAVLVMAYFMQLRYDNPMNTVVMLFCFFAVGLFLLFTSLDLFTRDKVYDFKATFVVQGGTYGGDKPLTAVRREEYVKKLGAKKLGADAPDDQKLAEGEKEAKRIKAAFAKHGHGHDEQSMSSTAQRSRPLAGSTGALETKEPHGASGHGEATKPAGHEAGASH